MPWRQLMPSCTRLPARNHIGTPTTRPTQSAQMSHVPRMRSPGSVGTKSLFYHEMGRILRGVPRSDCRLQRGLQETRLWPCRVPPPGHPAPLRLAPPVQAARPRPSGRQAGSMQKREAGSQSASRKRESPGVASMGWEIASGGRAEPAALLWGPGGSLAAAMSRVSGKPVDRGPSIVEGATKYCCDLAEQQGWHSTQHCPRGSTSASVQ